MARERGAADGPSPPTPLPQGKRGGGGARAALAEQERVSEAGHATVTDPAGEAARAIEQALELLASASAGLAAGDDERLAATYEIAASLGDHLARALWFLRRVQRERERGAAGQGAAAGAPAAG